MTIEVERLATLDDFVAVEAVQRRLFGDSPGAAFLGVPTLRTIAECGGLLLGVRANRVTRDLIAASVDLYATYDRFPALFSHFFAVAAEERGRGVGVALRLAQRQHALAAGVEVVRAWVDPLCSRDGHIWWNRLGAIGTAYERNVYGDLPDLVHHGLATDRVAVEWWLRSPRTMALIDGENRAAHFRAPLHQMVVATRTTVGASGHRVLAALDLGNEADNLLLEIPAEIGRLRGTDESEARRWRLQTREAFERLLTTGYLLSGLVHEGGRSFQLLERQDRSTILGREAARRAGE